jgi:hypothetical protein
LPAMMANRRQRALAIPYRDATLILLDNILGGYGK